MTKTKALSPKPEPLVIMLINFYPEWIHVSVSWWDLELRRGKGCDLFTLPLQQPLHCWLSWIQGSHAGGVMAEMSPLLSLKEVPSRRLSFPFSWLFSLASKFTTCLQGKSLSASSSIKMSFFIFHVLTHNDSCEGKIQALTFFCYELRPFSLEPLIRSDF